MSAEVPPTTDDVTQPTFLDELRALLNRHSVENRSDTPDYILAAFLQNVLVDYEHAVRARDRWWGHEPSTPKATYTGSVHFEETT